MAAGNDPVVGKEAVLVGAHLDHLGSNHELMPGAHDNASGVAVLLAVADAIAASKVPLDRTLVFPLFGAEEQGVKGSEFYVAHPFVPNAQVKALSTSRASAGASGSWSGRARTIRGRRRVRSPQCPLHPRRVTLTANAHLARPRQDAAHFRWANIPSVSLGTAGAPPLPYATYHTTKDRWETLTPEIMEDLARLVFLSTIELAKQKSAGGTVN